MEGMNMREIYQVEMNVCVSGKEVNSTFQFNPLVTKFTLSEGVVGGVVVVMDCQVCGVKEVLKEGKEMWR